MKGTKNDTQKSAADILELEVEVLGIFGARGSILGMSRMRHQSRERRVQREGRQEPSKALRLHLALYQN